MNDIEKFIESDPFLRALSNWMKEWDYDGWKEAVLWPDDDSVNFVAMSNSLRMYFYDEDIVMHLMEDE